MGERKVRSIGKWAGRREDVLGGGGRGEHGRMEGWLEGGRKGRRKEDTRTDKITIHHYLMVRGLIMFNYVSNFKLSFERVC